VTIADDSSGRGSNRTRPRTVDSHNIPVWSLADVGDGNCFALRVRGVDAVVSKGVGQWVELSGTPRIHPERAGTVFEQGINEHPAQAVAVAGLVLKHFELVAIVPVQPIL